jgi:hypothetical protein
MAVLSERQQLAKSLADALDKMDGAWVASPLPLDDHAKLRVQIKDIDRNRIIQWLRDLGWEPVCVSVLPRVCNTGLIGACLYEIDLPRDRQPVVDDRIHGDVVDNKREKNHEVEKMLESIYGRRK